MDAIKAKMDQLAELVITVQEQKEKIAELEKQINKQNEKIMELEKNMDEQTKWSSQHADQIQFLEGQNWNLEQEIWKMQNDKVPFQ